MNLKTHIVIAVVSCATFSLPALQAQTAELVTNGNFSAGSAAFGSSPTGWNATVGADGVGQFSPGVSAPLSGQVAYMGAGTQIIQTFSVGLAANTTYTVSFNFVGSVGDFSGTNTFNGFIGYGVGSGGTSAFGGFIEAGDILSGSNAWAPLIGTSTSSFSVSFTTPGIITGSANNLAIILNPVFDGVTGAQAYLDNVSVTATVIPEPSSAALLLGFGALGLSTLRRRRKAAA